eukprot:6164636-Amphidinium_carterae.1
MHCFGSDEYHHDDMFQLVCSTNKSTCHAFAQLLSFCRAMISTVRVVLLLRKSLLSCTMNLHWSAAGVATVWTAGSGRHSNEPQHRLCGVGC